MTRVAKRGLSAGAGRKGEKPAKKKPSCQEPPSDGNRVPFSPQSQVPFSPPSQVPFSPPSQALSSIVGVNSYGPQPTMPIYSPFSYFANMHVSPQFPTASQTPSLGFGAPSTPGEICTPFRLYILTGNITTCYGCKERFARAGPPYDLIVPHEEDRSFFNPRTGAPMFKRGNAYYHVYLPCIRMCWPSFDPHSLIILNFIELQSSHKQLLFDHFGLMLP